MPKKLNSCLSYGSYNFCTIESNSEAFSIFLQINGNLSKEDVFAQVDGALTELLEQKKAASGSLVANQR